MKAASTTFRLRVSAHKAVRLCALALIAVIAFSGIAARVRAAQIASDAERVHWAQLNGAQVKLDDKTPIHWNVYQPAKSDKKDKKDKKDSNFVLVLLGRRYLMLDIKAKTVYSVTPSDLQPQGSDFDSGDLADKSRVVPSSEWSDRDEGPAELVQFTLGDYGGVLAVSLPHMPDLRPFY